MESNFSERKRVSGRMPFCSTHYREKVVKRTMSCTRFEMEREREFEICGPARQHYYFGGL